MTFELYGLQQESTNDAKLAKMSTKVCFSHYSSSLFLKNYLSFDQPISMRPGPNSHAVVLLIDISYDHGNYMRN